MITVQQGQAAGKGMPADMLRDFGEEGNPRQVTACRERANPTKD